MTNNFYSKLTFKLTVLIALFFVMESSNAQSVSVYPSHWWTGMKMNKIQLLIKREDGKIFPDKKSISTKYPGVTINKVHDFENQKYIALDITIAPNAKPGTLGIEINTINLKEAFTIEYELKPKVNTKLTQQGVTSEDVVYLIMPDRFANGDPSNDFYTDMRDTGHNRNNPFDRHGGDLKGIENNISYFKDLGVTALWLTPVVENDMTRTQEGGVSRSTYHGYAFTNQYKVDKRFGGDEAYKSMINAAHKNGLKVIQDAVYNHLGNDHFLYADAPAKDWVNQWPKYQNTSYRDQPLSDPYAAPSDRKIAVDGWFTPFLVDVNQKNPYVAKFLIQYQIWATQEYGIDGWRVDTYFYSDENFLNNVNEAMYKEFPNLTMFGEAWMYNVPNTAYFCNNNMNVPFKHNSQGCTDFPYYYSLIAAMNEAPGWNDGINKFYQTIAQDYLYKDANKNCVFLDNHDLDRIHSVLGKDVAKTKIAHGILLTQRGIPQLYYGDEILMSNFKNPSDAEVRKDFEGGWSGDANNKFVASGRTTEENDFYNYLKTILQFRKNSNAIKKGKLTQYLPKDGVYTYFRIWKNEKVMVIINTEATEKKVDATRFNEMLSNKKTGINIINNEKINVSAEMILKGKEIKIISL